MEENGDNGSGRGMHAFVIICFYCGKKFKLVAEHPCFITKVFCNKKGCIRKHAEDKKNGGKRFEEYKAHLIETKNKYKKRKKFMVVFFVDEEKKVVFKENGEELPIRIGEIIPDESIPENMKSDDYVFVKEGLGLPGRINQYRRDVIRGLL